MKMIFSSLLNGPCRRKFDQLKNWYSMWLRTGWLLLDLIAITRDSSFFGGFGLQGIAE
jgi:hypothetical protein